MFRPTKPSRFSLIFIFGILTAVVLAVFLPFNLDDEFVSAINRNVCSAKDGGYGFGRVRWTTRNAQCLNSKKMLATCFRNFPNPREAYTENGQFLCAPENHFCVPRFLKVPTLNYDAGCQKIDTPAGGTKGAGDVDDIACSSGIKFDAPIYLLSKITADNTAYTDSITACSVQQEGSKENLSTLSPCTGEAGIDFDAGPTYEACITTADSVDNVNVAFHWFLRPDISTKKRDLSDMEIPSFTIRYKNETGDNRPRKLDP
ncbi:uncharacterized protein BKA78DRAFT_298623 [Phyllosticta capitalensis]|uniref:uncharacterized protein n=1 Tax=Phyllosticta capitalensis TaxID=121624 RepID=UPI0031310E20